MSGKERKMNNAIVSSRTHVCEADMRRAGRAIALSCYEGYREPSYINASCWAAGLAKEVGAP